LQNRFTAVSESSVYNGGQVYSEDKIFLDCLPEAIYDGKKNLMVMISHKFFLIFPYVRNDLPGFDTPEAERMNGYLSIF
jgi:hypothetical protein